MAERTLPTGLSRAAEDVAFYDRLAVPLGWRIRRHLAQKLNQVGDADRMARGCPQRAED
jgi:hypothetical protein